MLIDIGAGLEGQYRRTALRELLVSPPVLRPSDYIVITARWNECDGTDRHAITVYLHLVRKSRVPQPQFQQSTYWDLHWLRQRSCSLRSLGCSAGERRGALPVLELSQQCLRFLALRKLVVLRQKIL